MGAKNKYSNDYINHLENLYETRTAEEVAYIEDIPVHVVRGLLFYRSTHRKESGWTEDDIQKLMSLYPTKENSEISIILNRSLKSVHSKASRLGLKKIKFWTPKDISYLKNNYGTKKASEIGKYLSRTKTAVRAKATVMGLHKQGQSVFEAEFNYMLKELNISFKTQYKVQKFTADFFIEPNILIETYGDYWHCNPEIYKNGPTTLTQTTLLERDIRRKSTYKKHNYIFVIVWENDFYNNLEQVKENIIAVLNSNIQDNDRANSVELLRNKDNTEITSNSN